MAQNERGNSIHGRNEAKLKIFGIRNIEQIGA